MTKTLAAGKRIVQSAHERERGLHICQRHVDGALEPQRGTEPDETEGTSVRSIASRMIAVPLGIVTREALSQMHCGLGETPHRNEWRPD
jgi:hypothetical protein